MHPGAQALPGGRAAEPDARSGAGPYALLKTIDDPAALRSLDRESLRQLADELRAFVLDSVSQTGGRPRVEPGSVVMKRERLLPHRTYTGCPTREV